MTNEERAMEMFPEVPTLELMCKGIQEKLVEMAEWKEQQLKGYLIKKYHQYNHERINSTTDSDVAYGKWQAIYEIINELFENVNESFEL